MLQLDTAPEDRTRLEPASVEVLDGLWAALEISLDPFYVEFYRAFGGQSAPNAQMITLWPVERIVGERALSTIIDGRRYHAIGDEMIDSDFLMVSLEDAGAPAYLRYAGNRIADSATDLVDAIFDGRLAL